MNSVPTKTQDLNVLTDKEIVKNTIVLTDLDDTLITTQRKGSAHRGQMGMQLIAENSLATRNTVQLPWMQKLDTMLKTADCYVPVTGRTLMSAKKILENNPYDVLICHFGGFVQVPCDSDQLAYKQFAAAWNLQATEIRETEQSSLTTLANRFEKVSELYGLAIRISKNTTPDTRINEIVLKFEDNPIPNAGDFQPFINTFNDFIATEHAESCSLTTHINGNNFTVFIQSLSKAAAVSAFLSLHDTELSLIIGAGDSHSDLEFMKLTDVMLIPSNTQISKGLISERLVNNE